MADATLKMLLLGEDRGASRALKGVGDQAGKTETRVSRLGNVAGKVLAAGLLAGGVAAVKAGKAAVADEAAQSKLAQTLKTAAGASKGQVAATEAWITAQGKALGIADDELRPALGRLATATGDVSKAQDLTALAMDVAAGSGKSLTQVTEALQKGVNGSVGGLSRLGVATKDANGKTKSLDQITKELAKTYGGAAAKAADTTAGKQRKLTVQFGELQEQIGAKLIPVFETLTEKGLAIIDWMERHSTLTKVLAGVIGGLVVTLWLVPKVLKAWTAAQWLLNAAMTANPIGIVIVAIAALVAGLIYAYKKSEKFRAIVDGAFHVIAESAKWMWEKVLKPTFSFLVKGFVWVAEKIVSAAAWAFGWVPGLGPKLKAAAAKMKDFKEDVNRYIDGVKDPKIKVTTPGADRAISSLQTIKQLIKDINSAKPRNGGAQNLSQLLGGGRVGRRATGGPVRAGSTYLVGERGPEIFTAGRSGTIIPNHKIGGDAGYVVVVVRDESGRTLEQKLAKVKHDKGGTPLAFERAR